MKTGKLPLLLLMTALAGPALALEQLTDIAPLLNKPSLGFEPDNGWREDADGNGEYAIGMIRTAGMAEAEAAVIAARADATGRWNAGMMRAAPVTQFRGKRVRLAARLKSQDVGLAQLVLRFNSARGGGRTGQRTIAAPVIDGTHDWSRMEIVADIPADASALSYGFYIRSARGAAFADSFSLEAVGDAVRVSQNHLASYNPPNGVPLRGLPPAGGYGDHSRVPPMQRQPYE